MSNNEVQCVVDGKNTVLKLNVKNDLATGSDISSYTKKTFKIGSDGFTGQSHTTVGDLDFDYFTGKIDLSTAMNILSLAPEHKNELKLSKTQLVFEVGNKNNEKVIIVVLRNIIKSPLKNVMSLNKLMALMSFCILRNRMRKVWDWSTMEYKTVPGEPKKADSEPINRLAEQMGCPKDNQYYWLIIGGYEFLFDIFPREVCALAIYRLVNKEKLRIKLDDEKIVDSIVAKMNRRLNIGMGDFKAALTRLNLGEIKKIYIKFNEFVPAGGRSVRNESAVSLFHKLVATDFKIESIDSKSKSSRGSYDD
nr:putative nucleocapsid protein [Emaravirus sp.]